MGQGSHKRLGRYEVIKTLGYGGMGEVMLARQVGPAGLGRLVVLKTVLPHLAREPGFVERFLDEMRLMTLLTHGNIVQVYDVGEAEGQYYMAMEYVDGLDLREVLERIRKKGQRLPLEVVLHILVECCKALAYAHSKRDAHGNHLAIVHRDVSPANILVSKEGQVKLTDFGVAVATARTTYSLPGVLHGKVPYMSPEQVRGEEIDGRSDQFSLGVVAYEMLSLERPFEAETDMAIIERVRECRPKPLHEVAPYVDKELSAIVMRALAKSPDERFPDMNAFGAALESYGRSCGCPPSQAKTADFIMGLLEDEEKTVGDSQEGLLLTHRAQEREGEVFRLGEVLRALGTFLGLVLLVGVLGYVVRSHSQAPGGVVGDEETLIEVDERGDTLGLGEEEALEEASSEEEVSPSREEEQRTTKRVVTIRSTPEGAEVYRGEKRLGVTPLRVLVGHGGGLSFTLRMDGFESENVVLGPDSPEVLEVTMREVKKGKVRFRFFPADAEVVIDGKKVSTESNLVEWELPLGEHVLKISSARDGARREVRFVVKEGKVSELGTIDLADQDKSGSGQR